MKIAVFGTETQLDHVCQLIRRADPDLEVRRLQLPGPERPLPELVPLVNELLAEEDVRAAVVAGACPAATEAVRQAVQAGLPVLAYVPLEASADVHYELGVIAQETGAWLMPWWPLLADPCYEAFERCVRRACASGKAVLEIHVNVADDPSVWDRRVVELLGVAERLGFQPREVMAARRPTGELELSGDVSDRLAIRMTVRRGTSPAAELLLQTADGTACRWSVGVVCDGEAQVVSPPHDAQRAEQRLVERFVAAVGGEEPAGQWEEVLRVLAVVDAARHSLRRRRAELVTEGVASAETHFKATMAMWGCGLLWALVLIVPAAVVLESLGVRVGAVLAGGALLVLALFLVLQLLKPSG